MAYLHIVSQFGAIGQQGTHTHTQTQAKSAQPLILAQGPLTQHSSLTYATQAGIVHTIDKLSASLLESKHAQVRASRAAHPNFRRSRVRAKSRRQRQECEFR